MRAENPRWPIVAIVGAIVLAASGCSIAGVEKSDGTPSAGASQQSKTPIGQPSSPSPHAAVTPTFGPESITIVREVKDGSKTSLIVRAPENTRFATTDGNVTAVCRSTIDPTGPQVTYRVTCERAGPTLVSTISYGDFDYGFETALK